MTKLTLRALAFAALLSIAACNHEIEENGNGNGNKEPEKEPLVLVATFADPSCPVGKTSWTAEDKVGFMLLKSGSQSSTPLSPKSVSSDGAEATFEFPDSFPADADACYGFLIGGGADSFVDGHSVSVPRVNSESVQPCPVTVAKADLSSRKLVFRNVYPHISFVIETTGVSNVVFEGSNAEPLSRKSIVNLDDFSITPAPQADETSTSMNVTVNGPGTYFIPLYPGLSLSRGYKLTAYGANGKAMMTAASEEALTAEAGRIYSAPQFVEIPHNDTFDATKVAFSFGMLSDTHIDASNGQNCQDKLLSALRQLGAQAARDDADGLDAVCISGDFTNYGYSSHSYNDSEISTFKRIYESVYDPLKVPMIYAVGNHDPVGWWTNDVYNQARYIKNCFGDGYSSKDIDNSLRDAYECRHCVVGTYHILCVTPYSSQPVSYPSAVVDWLDKTLSDICAKDPDHYVILLTHPMIYNTVYGSLLGPEWMFGTCTDYWYTKSLTSVLEKYPQVMTFSGHLHFPVNDPRSIWQGAFTAFGCGSTRYMAIEDGKYEDMSSGTVMKDAAEVSSGLLLQFDQSGNARITKMFFSQNTTFDYPWEISHPAADKSHLETYNSARRKAANTSPALSGLDVTFADAGASAKIVYAKFAAGSDDEFVHHYVVSVKKGNATLATRRILSDFYKHQWADQMTKSYTQNMGSFGSGDYTLVLEAYDSWDAVTTITKDFTVDAGAVTPSTPAVLYADIDFTGGEVKDVKGKLTVTNKGATIGKVQVAHKGRSASVDAVTASTGKNVECRFNEISSAGAFQEFASSGFSVETFFVDRSPGTQIHGVVCGTEQGGWGTATRATGVPYFIVGDVSKNNYVSVDASAAASKTDLTHLVAVYDPSKRYIRLYINGVLDGQTPITCPFYPGDGDTFNRFYLGADVKYSGSNLDFQAVDMVITEARFYTGVLDENAVSSAYQEAVNTLK